MLLADMTKEQLEILAREKQADLICALESKKRVLDKNAKLVEQVVELTAKVSAYGLDNIDLQTRVDTLERENYYLVKKMRDNGLM